MFHSITWSNFTQILKSWTFLNSSSSWLLKNVQDHWIWAKFDRDMAKTKKGMLSRNFHFSGFTMFIEINFLCKSMKKNYETVKIGKIHWKLKYSKSRYCFANISATEARIFMKFYVVVNFYLVSLSFKFHEDPFVNGRARGGNPCKTISTFWIL